MNQVIIARVPGQTVWQFVYDHPGHSEVTTFNPSCYPLSESAESVIKHLKYWHPSDTAIFEVPYQVPFRAD